ncbi:MAG TPA: chloramphenicol acetyltransferase [Thermoanaerobaculia bacterium]|nr:chloramphenicol acetyltransferase [Thermoanaerobaculia bacterium]
MRDIDLRSSPRRRHYEFFRALDYPHFNVCANVDAARLRETAHSLDLPFFKAILYCAVRTANEIPELRQRIRGERVVEHEVVHPSYTSMTDAGVFSFTDVRYHTDPREFLRRCAAAEGAEASLEDDPERDDYLFVTSLPWIHFTSFQHPIHVRQVDSVPRLTWGRAERRGERVELPFSLQSHHALVDGAHVGRFFTLLQEALDDPAILGAR